MKPDQFLYQNKTMDSRRPKSKKNSIAGTHYYSVNKKGKRHKADISDSSTSSASSALQISHKYAGAQMKSPRLAKKGLHATPGKRVSSGKKHSVRQF